MDASAPEEMVTILQDSLSELALLTGAEPVSVFFEGPSARLVLHTAAVVGGFFAFMLWFWKRGLRAYASASS